MTNGLFEYLLIISPAKEVCKRVMEEKWRFFRNYGQPTAIKSKPHIVVSNFLAWDSMEDTLTRWLQNIAREQRSFRVLLNNYSGLPSHTVYIRIQELSGFKELNRRLKAIEPFIKDYNCQPKRLTQCPNLSIAGELPEPIYESAIREYSGRDFSASFNVTELALLRRQSKRDQYKQVAVFRLLPNENNN